MSKLTTQGKVCTWCQELLPRTAFFHKKYPSGYVGVTSACRQCLSSQRTTTGSAARNSKRWREVTRRQVIAHYSDGTNRCKCCGESEYTFLAIDHVDNDGRVHRKKLKANSIVAWLIQHNYPEGFQVLCHNCNMGKSLNGGVCPHQLKTAAA